MDSMILELQNEAARSVVGATELLRKALVVATKLNIKEFESWIRLELNGYPDLDQVPQYRMLSGTAMARTFRGWEPVDTHLLDDDLQKRITSFKIPYAIGEIETSLGDGTSAFMVTYDKKAETSLMKALSNPGIPAVRIERTRFQGILDAARTIVLEWTLKLEKQGISGGRLTFTDQERVSAAENTYHIQNYIHQMSYSQIIRQSHLLLYYGFVSKTAFRSGL